MHLTKERVEKLLGRALTAREQQWFDGDNLCLRFDLDGKVSKHGAIYMDVKRVKPGRGGDRSKGKGHK